MNIILLYPKWTSEYGIFSYFPKNSSSWPPLNLAYLAAIAEDLGHNVKIIDGEVENISLEKMIDQTELFKPDIIAITATTPFYHIATNLAKGLKKRMKNKDMKNIPVIIGGHHISVLKEKAFYHCFDYAFIGEADKSWPLFLNKYDKGEIDNGYISDIKGILYRDKKENIKFTGDPDQITDIDSIPFPARHLLKMEKYRIGTPQGIKKFTTIMTVRGCPFSCIFCSTNIFGKKIRKRSPTSIIEEIKSVVNKFGIKHFIFLDDTLTLDRDHILKICDLIEKEKIKEGIKEKMDITFEGSTRANLIDEEIISKMASAGLIRLSFGLESVDKKIRKIMKKDIPLESYVLANKLVNKYNIELANSCMIGLPGESINTIKKTLSFLRKFREIKNASVSIAVPYPGTELYEMAKRGDYELKLLTNDFSKFRRYNIATMNVGNLSSKDLIKLQNDAFASIYVVPWRLIPMLRKSGVSGCILTLSRIMKSIIRGRLELLMIDQDYWQKDNLK